jgi:hypothetical protein
MCPIKDEKTIVRLPRVGKLHLGIKEPSKKNPGKEYPKQVDYFVFPEEWLETVKSTYGTDKPTKLPILIPVDDEEIWAPRYYKRYNSAGDLLCKGDGEMATCMIDLETGAIPEGGTEGKKIEYKEITCDGMDCLAYGEKCVKVMSLQFILPDLPGGFGVWQLDSKSINGWRNIQATAQMIRMAYGTVAMVPGLILTIEHQDIKDPNRKKRNMPILNLRTEITFKGMLLDAQRRLSSGNPVYALPAANEDAPELLLPENQIPEDEREEAPQVGKPVTAPPVSKSAQAEAEKTSEQMFDELKSASEQDEPEAAFGEEPEPPMDFKKFLAVACKINGELNNKEALAKALGWKKWDDDRLHDRYEQALDYLAKKFELKADWRSL